MCIRDRERILQQCQSVIAVGLGIVGIVRDEDKLGQEGWEDVRDEEFDALVAEENDIDPEVNVFMNPDIVLNVVLMKIVLLTFHFQTLLD